MLPVNIYKLSNFWQLKNKPALSFLIPSGFKDESRSNKLEVLLTPISRDKKTQDYYLVKIIFLTEVKLLPSTPAASILYRYTPLFSFDASNVTVWFPAVIFWFSSVTTSCPRISNTFNVTFESTFNP